MLTKRQKQVLSFLQDYTRGNGYAPSLQEIADYLGVSSVGTVHEHLGRLEDKGYIEKADNQPRSIELNQIETMVQVPLLGLIAAGEPIEVIHGKEHIAVPKDKLPKTGNLFALKVQGESMVEENINDSDVILVKEQKTAEQGQKVVALIDGDKATVKKFYKEKGRVKLQPANKKLEPIFIDERNDLEIQGVVLGVVEEPKLPSENNLRNEKKYKELPLNQIIKGDALKKLRKIPDESFDIIIVDPPYNIGKDFGNGSDKKSIPEYILWSKKWIDECTRILKPTGTLFVYGFSEILAHLSVEIPLEKRWLIWHYTNKNVPSLKFWQRSHEAVVCAWKKGPIFNRDEVREPYTESFLKNSAGKVRKSTAGRFSNGEKETVYKAHRKGALPRDVIKISALAGGAGRKERWFLCKGCDKVFSPDKRKGHDNHKIKKHPTQKPFELSEKLIKSALPKKDGRVLVPFVGSGSECAAAKKLGANYLGFELNKDYIRIAEKFVESIKEEKNLFTS